MKEINKWNPDEYGKHTAFVSELALPVMDLLDPKDGERILDIGCGDGTLALEIKSKGADVIGVDLSKEMVEVTKAKGIETFIASVTDLPFDSEFDAIFSNAVLHWVKDANLAVQNIAKSLKSKGRFVTEFGGKGNMQSVVEVMEEVFVKHPEFGEFNNPWYFPTVSEYKKLLEEFGFEVEYIELIDRLTPMSSLAKWLDIFANGICQNLTNEQFEVFKQEVEEIAKDNIYTTDSSWILDYKCLRVKAIKQDR